MDIDIFQLPGIVRKRLHYVVFSVLACVALAAGFLVQQKPLYRSTAELYVDMQRGPVVGSGAGTGLDTQQLIGSQLYFLLSRDVLRDVVKRLDLTKDPYLAGPAATGDATDGVVDAIAANLLVERNGESFVFAITMKHRDSAMAAKIANAVGESYLRLTDSSRLDANLKTSTAIAEETEQLRQRVLEARAAVETFRAENGLLSTGQQGLITDQQLAALNQQLLAARQQAEQQKAAYDQARKLNLSDVESGAIPEALQSASLSGLRTRYGQMLERQAELSANLGNGHPQMRAVHSQISTMRAAIEKELARIRELTANTYERANANLAAVQKRFDEQTAANGDNGKVRFRLAQLVSEADTLDAVYKSFLTRAEELGRQQDLGAGNSRIISAAVPSSNPVRAPRLLVLAAAVLFGTAAGAALAVLREIVGGSLRSEQDLVTKTGAPVLGTIAAAGEARGDGRWSDRLARVVPFAQRAERREMTPRISGLTRAAHLIEAQFEPGVPATIAVLSAGGAGENAAFGLARELQALGEEVLFSDGTLRRPAQGRFGAGGSVRIRTDIAAVRRDGPSRGHPQALEDMLSFRRIGAAGLRKVTALSSARVSTAFRDAPAGFTIIDCCGTPAEAILPAVLRHVDGILVVSALGATGAEALTALVAEIAPWRDKLIGNILVGDRAA